MAGRPFFFAIFSGSPIHSHTTSSPHRPTRRRSRDGVARGKHVWEKNSCINCHTILGEGAYFAPELGNVWMRWGGDRMTRRRAARCSRPGWSPSPPASPGRRQMPQFNLTDQEFNDLADFLEWTSNIKTQNWPPNNAG